MMAQDPRTSSRTVADPVFALVEEVEDLKRQMAEKDEGYYRAAMKRIRNKPITLEKTMAAADRPPATLEDFAP